MVWDFRENGPVQWMGAAREEYRGPKTGALVPPGTYSVRIALDGKTYTQPLQVKADPRASLTQADYQTMYEFSKKYFGQLSSIDQALNKLDAVNKALTQAQALAGRRGGAALLEQVKAAQSARKRVFDELTADFHNDEDSIQRPGSLREDIPGLLRVNSPPLPAQLEYAAQIDARYAAAMADYNEFLNATLGKLNAALKGAGLTLIAP